ncbi:MAG: glycine cleavage T C-terminal barrel domain-containing protein [Clostridiales bacterium]
MPYLNGAYAMALVNTANAVVGTELAVDVRGRKITVEVVALPLYSRSK